MQELLRPWKLLTFAFGIGLMLFGATLDIAPDWDIGISILMPVFAYITAPWCVRMLIDRRWTLLPLVVLIVWIGVDGIYTVYWGWKQPDLLENFRVANFRASLPLYCLCGMGWFYRGSLSELIHEVRAAWLNRTK